MQTYKERSVTDRKIKSNREKNEELNLKKEVAENEYGKQVQNAD